jgi:DNA modification methylase
MACTDRERWWDEIAISPLAGPVPLDHWRIKASNYTGAHYATFPPELLTIPIEAMCPRRVCRSCGQPSRRVGADGWTTCGCSGTDGLRANGWHTGTGWRAGVVLDPYAGTGTTGLVASGHSRDAVLIDIDERNAELAQERIGPLGGLTVHTKGNDVWTF